MPSKKIIPEKLNDEELRQQVINLLEGAYWLNDLNTMCRYTRNHDDDNGTRTGKINVIISGDGDTHMWIDAPSEGGSLRFRTYHGGGLSLRVRNAIVLLALAIKMDNEERPISKSPV